MKIVPNPSNSCQHSTAVSQAITKHLFSLKVSGDDVHIIYIKKILQYILKYIYLSNTQGELSVVYRSSQSLSKEVSHPFKHSDTKTS